MLNELLSTTFNWFLLHPSNENSVTSIFSCIIFLHSTLCRLHLGMLFIPSCDTCFLLSDFGFRQTLEVRTLGCARRFRLLPTCTPPPRLGQIHGPRRLLG